MSESTVVVKFGAPVCIFGDLVFDKKSQKMFITNIKYISDTWDGLLQQHKQGTMIHTAVKWGALILGAVVMYKFFKKMGRVYDGIVDPDVQHMRHQEVLARRQQIYAMLTLQNQGHPRMKGLKCSDCKRASKNVINMPCRHITHCKDCFSRLGQNLVCPDCGQRVNGHSEFFLT